MAFIFQWQKTVDNKPVSLNPGVNGMLLDLFKRLRNKLSEYFA